jgi:hypothetical protein
MFRTVEIHLQGLPTASMFTYLSLLVGDRKSSELHMRVCSLNAHILILKSAKALNFLGVLI